MISEGNHKVKVVGCFTGESAEKKTPYYGIEFETKDGESINWLAYLTDTSFMKGGKETTMKKENMKTLVQLGFCGRSLADLSNTEKKISELFNEVDGINILVEHEEYTNEETGEVKTAAKVKFVNVGYGPNKFDHKQAVVKFKSLGLDGELLKLQKELGVKSTKKSEPKEETESESTELSADDIPF